MMKAKQVSTAFYFFMVLVSAVGSVILLVLWISDWNYIHKSAPLTIGNYDLIESPLQEAEYVQLHDFCMNDYAAQQEDGNGMSYFYVAVACDSTDTRSPSIIVVLDEEEFGTLTKTDVSSYEVMQLFEGRLEKGYTGARDLKRHISRKTKTDMKNTYTLHSGVTPKSIKKRVIWHSLFVLTGIAGGLFLLNLIKVFTVKQVQKEALRKQFFEDMYKNS